MEQLKNASAQAYKNKMDELQETIQNCGDALSQHKAEVELDYRQRNEELDAELLDVKVTSELLQNGMKQLENDRAMVRMGKRQNEREREKLDADRRSLEADRREFDAEKQGFEARVMDEVARREEKRALARNVSDRVQMPNPNRNLPQLNY